MDEVIGLGSSRKDDHNHEGPWIEVINEVAIEEVLAIDVSEEEAS